MLFNRKALWLILGLALILRVALAYQWHQQNLGADTLFRFGDSHSYWTLAENLAAGKPYQYGSENASIFRAPLLPLYLTPFTMLGSPEQGVLAARMIGCFIGVFAVYVITKLARRLGGDCAGIAAGVVAAFSPAAAGMSFMILSEMLFIPLMLLHLVCWQNAYAAQDRSRQLRDSALGGLCAGLAVLARPSWLLFIPFSSLLGLLIGKQRSKHVLIGFVSLVTLSITMCPWWVRNYQITGRFVPTTLQVGPSLYDGLHEGATGASDEGMNFMSEIYQKQVELDRTASLPLESTLEYRLNQLATREAVSWARSNPSQVLQLALAKFQKTWGLWPDGGQTGSPAIRLALTVGCFSTLLLATVGMVAIFRKTLWLAAICWLPCLYFTLLHMVFVGSIRYREPGVFLLSALAGCGLAWLARCRPTPQILEPQSSQGSAAEKSKLPRSLAE